MFDQYIGDIFSVRVAGHVVDEDVLGSLEYASAKAGAKLVVVMGHTNCGAVKGACDHVEMGHLTTLVKKIKASVDATETSGPRNSTNHDFVDDVAHHNVSESIRTIRRESSVLRELEEKGAIRIVGAMYDTATGKVTWTDE